MTPEQCREARRLLGWSRLRLASLAGTYVTEVDRFENGKGVILQPTIAALRRALEVVGVEFTDGETPGVRLRAGSGE